ncbi:MAG: T9SS type A sorting domain-containing protein [Candidatus Eisenbacteria bacterium]|uniref:T9SS type A sorting domain-containing protein n=1 Tax=Eiseniibacteriota bacterium TaxID=2212470 RepID=A0A948W5T8_UNCEI|nr:T9SS type A sorting domain-containing protein [Candidatus Eisenbacteria bacterium]MBU1949135.1 T9SS type A sorting domain-containing protein [Candidatus Eisenbacteria bacterium]MBU2690789.1 T9SS type A sorting domain-containing protein [Candidatus Eisenbacteria bacterium]
MGAGLYAEMGSHLMIENSIIAFNTTMQGLVTVDTSTAALACCDIYGNEGGDWVGSIAGQYGVDGNISLDPIFCDPLFQNFTLQSDSPCLAFSPPNTSCDLLGAWPQGCLAAATVEWGDDVPAQGRLSSCSPNPFQFATQITYIIPETSPDARVQLRIIDLQGRVIQTLVDGNRSPGVYQAAWDGTNQIGASIADGIYFYQMKWNGKTETRRLALVK